MYHIDFNHPNHVHFIGIGGISMSGLAEILLERGFTVSGSDAHESELTKKLEELKKTEEELTERWVYLNELYEKICEADNSKK